MKVHQTPNNQSKSIIYTEKKLVQDPKTKRGGTINKVGFVGEEEGTFK